MQEMQEIRVWFLGWEKTLEEERAATVNRVGMHRWWKATCIVGTSKCTKMNSSLCESTHFMMKTVKVQGTIRGGIMIISYYPRTRRMRGQEKILVWKFKTQLYTNLSWDHGQNLGFLATGTQICKMKGWVRQSLRFFPSLKKLEFDIKIYLTIFILFIYFWWWRVLVAAYRTFVAARGLLLSCSSWAQ